jgi:hypothetical protein
MIINTKTSSYTTWKFALIAPMILSAILLCNSANTFAQSKPAEKTVPVQAKKSEVKKSEADYILSDLIAMKIISGKESDLSFKLNSEELTINSKKQPESVHQKFIKYLKGNSHKTVSYKVSTN